MSPDRQPGRQAPTSANTQATEAPTPAENPNREAIQRAMERRRRRDQEARERLEEARYRPMDFEPLGYGWGGYASRSAVGLVLAAIWMLVSAVIWLVEALRWPAFYTVSFLDTITGAKLLGIAPWLVWTLWGGIFGGCLGYWLIAPLYGHKEHRNMVLVWPVLAMLTVALLTWAFIR